MSPTGVDRIRREAPLVHNVTNLVAMTLSANVLIAVGASPIMSAAPEEAGELAAMSGALVVNIGTLTAAWIEGAQAAVAGARGAGRPWILDPVGVGATAFRRATAQALVAQKPADHPRQRVGDPGPGPGHRRRQGCRQHRRHRGGRSMPRARWPWPPVPSSPSPVRSIS